MVHIIFTDRACRVIINDTAKYGTSNDEGCRVRPTAFAQERRRRREKRRLQQQQSQEEVQLEKETQHEEKQETQQEEIQP